MKKRILLITIAFMTLATSAFAQDEKLITPDGTYLFDKNDGEELTITLKGLFDGKCSHGCN